MKHLHGNKKISYAFLKLRKKQSIESDRLETQTSFRINRTWAHNSYGSFKVMNSVQNFFLIENLFKVIITQACSIS